MKRSSIGFFLTLCFLLQTGYRQLYAHQCDGNYLSALRNDHLSIVTPVSNDSDAGIYKSDAAEVEEGDELTSVKKQLESPFFFSISGNPENHVVENLQSCKPLSHTLSYKWYLVYEVFRV